MCRGSGGKTPLSYRGGDGMFRALPPQIDLQCLLDRRLGGPPSHSVHGNIADLLYSTEWWFLLISKWSTAPRSQTILLRHLSAHLTAVEEAVDMEECEQYACIEDLRGIILVLRTLVSQFVVVESMALDSLCLQWNRDQRRTVRA